MGLLQKVFNVFKAATGLDLAKRIIDVDNSKVGGLVGGNFTLKQGKNSQCVVIQKAADPSVLHELTQDPKFDMRELIKQNPELFFGATRTDLLDYDAAALNSDARTEHYLTKMKQLFSYDDVVCLSTSISIKKIELRGQTEQAIGLKYHLVKKYGERGRRILNLYVSGILDEIILPAIDWLDYSNTITDRENVKQLWDACLEDMEYVIFVNSSVDKKEIVSRLKKRFRFEKLEFIIILGRTPAIISKIKDAVEEFIKLEDEYQIDRIKYSVEEKIYQYGKCDTIRVLVSIVK